jgi:hypothetical protein
MREQLFFCTALSTGHAALKWKKSTKPLEQENIGLAFPPGFCQKTQGLYNGAEKKHSFLAMK